MLTNPRSMTNPPNFTESTNLPLTVHWRLRVEILFQPATARFEEAESARLPDAVLWASFRLHVVHGSTGTGGNKLNLDGKPLAASDIILHC